MESLTVPAVLDSLRDIRRFTEKAVSQGGLGDKAAYNLTLAIDEIATNVIVHGFVERNLNGSVTVESEVTPEEVRVAIVDEGPHFDPRGVIAPGAMSMDKPLEERPIGGLGIYLAVNGVDRFDYEYEDGKNKNIFVMNRRA